MRSFEKHLYFLTFTVLAIVGLFYHEMWSDEARAWIVSLHTGVTDLIPVLSREAHPIGWYLVLKLGAMFSSAPVTAQIASSIFGITASAAIAYRAPFSRIEKILLAMNFFILYEYTVISRSYSMEMCFLYLSCVVYPDRWKRPFLFLLCCSLLAWTHVIGMMIAICFLGAYAFEFFTTQKTAKTTSDAKPYWFSMAMCAAFIFFNILSIAFPGRDTFDRSLGVATLSGTKFGDSIAAIVKNVIVIVDGDGHLWNSAFGYNLLWIFLGGFLVATFFAAFIWSQRFNKFVLLSFVGTTAGLFLINLLNPYTANSRRHLGHFTLLIVAGIWMARTEGSQRKSHSEAVCKYLFLFFLLTQAYSGIYALWTDVQRPFSYGKEVATYIESDLPGYRVIPDSPFFSVAYFAYLNRMYYDPYQDKEVYYPLVFNRPGAWEFKNIFSGLPIPGSPAQALHETILKNICAGNEKNVVVTNYALAKPVISEFYSIRENKKFERAINPFENYIIYEIILKKPAIEICQK